MLILARSPGKKILIGPIGDPTITVELIGTRFGSAELDVNGRTIELRIGQSVAIAPDIGITLMEIDGRQVRLGISAPKSVPVHRAEVASRIAAEEREIAARNRDAQFRQQLTRVAP